MYTYVSNPYCKVTFATEKGNLEIFQLAKETKTENLDYDILSLDTTRDVGADDCATFNITLAYRSERYKLINSCDLVKIELGRGKEKGTVLYGLVDNTYESLAYVDLVPQRVINVSGRGFNKAFMQFDIGAIQEINAVYNMVGFYVGQDAVRGQNSPSKLIKIAIEYYLEKGIDLKFANGKSFKDYYKGIYLENKRQKEESIGNPYNSYEYQGSLWEYLKELRNAPYNELFWEIIDDKPTLISRPTPFNPTDWTSLSLIKVDKKDIMDQQLGRSDLETYTVFSVKGESLITEFDQMFGAPIWYKPYYKRYGLRRLQVTSKYNSAGDPGLTGDSDSGGGWKVASHETSQHEIESEEQLRVNEEFNEAHIESQEKRGNILKAEDIKERTGYDGDDEKVIEELREKLVEEMKEEARQDIALANSNSGLGVSQKTVDLFNWNIKNNKMENGSLILRGDCKYKVGCRLHVPETDMEYYIENVAHNFVYSEGWKTTLEVTRGLKFGTRFTKPWNQWRLIEPEDLFEITGAHPETTVVPDAPIGYGGSASGGNVRPIPFSDPTGFRASIGAIAKSHAGEIYNMGQLRMNEGYSDCSSFVYKVAMEALGRNWRGTWAPATWQMIDEGKRLKLWYQIPLSEVKPWDIVLRDGHTEFLGDDGRTYGAHSWGIPSGPSKWQYNPNNWTWGLRIYGL